MVHAYLRAHYDPLEKPDQQGIVHLMPGVFGPSTAANPSFVGNGEHLPIFMRDRVHLRGVGARRCVNRGVNSADPEYLGNLRKVFRPSPVSCTTPDPNFPGLPLGLRMKEVLVDYSISSRHSATLTLPPPPWSSDPFGETVELIDAVIFQGGDVQVLFGFDDELPVPLRGRLSNCLFDLRDLFAVENGYVVEGASIGVLMEKTWIDEVTSTLAVVGEGYLDQEVHLAWDTFLMAELLEDGDPGTTDWYRCRPGAVALVDVTYPFCDPGLGYPLKTLRGVGHPGIQDDLFGSFTFGEGQDSSEMAMIGITADDLRVSSGPAFVDTNAYSRKRAGAASLDPFDPDQSFVSVPSASSLTGGSVDYGGGVIEPLWNGPPAGSAPTTPAVAIWDGDGSLGTQFDPAFVGEYLRTVSPAQGSYRDWRLIPGSPLQGMGRWDGVNTFASTVVSYPEDPCPPLAVSTWDHERLGNPRIVDGQPDIGFDEVHLGVVCGSYANHSFGHDRKGQLTPHAEDEQDARFVMLRELQPGGFQPLAGRTLRFASNEIAPGQNNRAWTNPPGSLSQPTPQSNSLPGYDLLYTSTAQPVGWMQTSSTVVPAAQEWPNWQMAPMPDLFFSRGTLPSDDEGSGLTSWVNVQLAVSKPGDPTVPILYGSMQPESR